MKPAKSLLHASLNTAASVTLRTSGTVQLVSMANEAASTGNALLSFPQTEMVLKSLAVSSRSGGKRWNWCMAGQVYVWYNGYDYTMRRLWNSSAFEYWYNWPFSGNKLDFIERRIWGTNLSHQIVR